MLLSELEPGTLFTLTDKSVKAERSRLTQAGMIPHANRLSAGPFQLMLPQYEAAVTKSMQTPEIHGINGAWFAPDYREQYGVEVLPKKSLIDHNLPSRSWIWTSADPEVFLEQGGEIVPGFAVLPVKRDPGRAYEGGGVFHEDGFQAEFSPAAYQCHETLLYSTSHAITDMMEYVNRGRKAGVPEITISDATFVELSPELLAVGSDDQVALGCDRSENVWGHSGFTHDNPREFPYRMAGGHIHFGVQESAKWFHSRAERIIKAMDLFVGVPSVALLADMEDPRRRQYYGRAGEFRYQKHGLEYRVLSNAWLQHTALAHMVLNLARGAFRLGTSDWEKDFKYDSQYIRHIINNHDVNAAKQFVEENAKILIWLMTKDSGQGWGAKALTTIHQGAKSVFGKELGIGKSWLNQPDPERFHQFVRNRVVKSWPGHEEPKMATPPRTVGIPLRSMPAPPVTERAQAEINDLYAEMRRISRAERPTPPQQPQEVSVSFWGQTIVNNSSAPEGFLTVTTPQGRSLTVPVGMPSTEIDWAARETDRVHAETTGLTTVEEDTALTVPAPPARAWWDE